MQENNNREGMEINLQKLLLTYVRFFWLILAAAIVVGLASLWYTRQYVTPMYRASTTIYVNNFRSDATVEYITGSNLQASQQLVSTYVNIIKSDTVLSRVVDNSALPYTPGQLRSMITTAQVGETELFRVHVTHEDPYMAADVANAIASEALAGIEEFVEGSSAKVVDYATVPEYRYTPNYSKNALLGAFVGGAAAVMYVTLRFLLDVRIKISEDLEQMYEIPVLGQIPVFVTADQKKKGYGYSRYGYGRRHGYTKNGYGYESEHTVKTEGGEE